MVQKSYFTGLIGGGLCLIWALLAWLGHRVRAAAVSTLMGMGFLFLADTVALWQERGAGRLSAVLTSLTVVTVLLLTALAHNLGGPKTGRRPPSGLER